MSVFSRFRRWMKSLFGGAISAMEDPKLILEENIRELNDQVPKMNENIATVKANVLMLEKEVRRDQEEVEQLTSKVKAAIQADRDDVAEKYAVKLEKARSQLEHAKEQLKHASAAYDKALQVKKTFMREKEKKIETAKQALREHERAKWQAEVADALEQFEISGLDQTHDEMLRRIREDTAKNEARMELALDSVDTDELAIEEEAEQIRAQELVSQFKLEMGVGEPDKAAASPEDEEGELEIPEEDVSTEERTKTIGRERTE